MVIESYYSLWLIDTKVIVEDLRDFRCFSNLLLVDSSRDQI